MPLPDFRCKRVGVLAGPLQTLTTVGPSSPQLVRRNPTPNTTLCRPRGPVQVQHGKVVEQAKHLQILGKGGDTDNAAICRIVRGPLHLQGLQIQRIVACATHTPPAACPLSIGSSSLVDSKGIALFKLEKLDALLSVLILQD